MLIQAGFGVVKSLRRNDFFLFFLLLLHVQYVGMRVHADNGNFPSGRITYKINSLQFSF
jgi:hypothetical protein